MAKRHDYTPKDIFERESLASYRVGIREADNAMTKAQVEYDTVSGREWRKHTARVRKHRDEQGERS